MSAACDYSKACGSDQDVLIAGLVVLLALAAGFTIFCLIVLARTREVRHLPKSAWALIICASTLWGGFAFLLWGAG